MHDLIIIGAGPAGLTAGIYAGRYRLNTLILEKASVGGQIILSPTIENFPGFPGGISTQELIDRLKQQVEELGLKIESEEAVEIIPQDNTAGRSYSIKTKDKVYPAKAVIIACGAQARRLGVPGEERLIGRGVSYCATCDAPFFKDKEVAVIGGGDKAVEEALYLTQYAKKVNLIHRRDRLRASRILEEKAKQNPKINFVFENTIEEITGQNKVEAVKIKNVKNNVTADIICQGVFILVGITPNTSFVKNLLQADESGFIITGQDMKTSEDGIFAAGDCCKRSLYQVISAASDGAVAAACAHNYLVKY